MPLEWCMLDETSWQIIRTLPIKIDRSCRLNATQRQSDVEQLHWRAPAEQTTDLTINCGLKSGFLAARLSQNVIEIKRSESAENKKPMKINAKRKYTIRRNKFDFIESVVISNKYKKTIAQHTWNEMKFKCSHQYATMYRRQEKPIKNWIQIFAYAMQTKSNWTPNGTK